MRAYAEIATIVAAVLSLISFVPCVLVSDSDSRTIEFIGFVCLISFVATSALVLIKPLLPY